MAIKDDLKLIEDVLNWTDFLGTGSCGAAADSERVEAFEAFARIRAAIESGEACQ